MNELYSRLRQSRVAEWTLAYLAFAWLVVQIIDVVADVWLISDIAQKRIHVVLALGLPATSVLAWFHGERGAQRLSRTELLVLAALAGITALAIPSVGVTEPVRILGIPHTLILPCALVTLIAIPVILIVAAARRQVMTPVPRTQPLQDADIESDVEAIESSIWQKILQARTYEDLRLVHVEVEGLLRQYPESARLMRLEARLCERRGAKYIGANRPEPSRRPADRELESPLDSALGPPASSDEDILEDWDKTGFASVDDIPPEPPGFFDQPPAAVPPQAAPPPPHAAPLPHAAPVSGQQGVVEMLMALTLRVTSFHSQALGADSARVFGAEGGSIGHALDNDWVLPDPEKFVSSHHAQIVCRGGNFFVKDTSTNGTYINGSPQPVGNGMEQQLFDGDRIQIGDYEVAAALEPYNGQKPLVRAARPPGFLIWNELKKRRIPSIAAKYLLIVGMLILIGLSVFSPYSLSHPRVHPGTVKPVSLFTVLFILIVFGLSVTVVVGWYHGRRKRSGA